MANNTKKTSSTKQWLCRGINIDVDRHIDCDWSFLFFLLFLRRLLILLLLLLLRLDIGRVPAAQAAVRLAAHTAAARSATVLRTAIELTTAPPHREITT